MYINNNTSSKNPIDREQVKQQLAALEYKAGDRVYLRAFFPSSDSRKNNDAGRKTEATNIDQLIEAATKFQSEGRGVYIVVNGGGHTDKAVTTTRAIFYEHDNLDKATQTDLWKGLGLPEPTLQIDTGGKSIHSYWMLEEPATVADWKSIQADLLEFADADRALKNPSRVMRLAGAWHSSGKQSLITSNSGKRYSYADLRSIIPTEKAEPTLFQEKQPENNSRILATVPEKYEDITLPVPGSVPLEVCLAKASRDLLNGISEGGRNVAGHKLACDLIGTATYLQAIGQRFDGDVDSLFQDFANRCSPALSTGELKSIWKSAQSSNPSPACKSEGVENCIKGWYWNSIRPMSSDAGMQTNVVTHPSFKLQPLTALPAEIDALLNSDLKRSELNLEILRLSQKYRLPDKEVRNLYKTREEEQEQADSREDIAAEVEALLKSKNSHLDIAEIIPTGLAAPIAELAARLNLKPECYLTTLLTQVSSLFKVGSEVKLRNDTNYRVTPNYFAGIVAESSQKKSPIMREIIDRPMQTLREQARKEFEKAQEAYEQELANWKASKGEDKGAAPKAPRQKLYSFSKTTGEGILYQVAEHPDQGLMYRCDELASLFKSANQYRGGKGSDDEDLLEYWNGTGSTVLRASGIKADLDGLLLSVFGTIQPDVLATLLKDCSDSNGKFARFDFVIQPLAASKLSLEDSGSFDLTPMLSDLYQKIDALPALKLELEPDAKRYFTQFYNAVEDKRVAEPMQGKRAMIGKAPEKVGKLAVVIHTLNCVFNGQPVTNSIPKEVIKAAVKFVMFTASQIDVLYTEFSDRTALAPNLVKILTLAERKGGAVSVRDVSACFTSKYRPTGGQVREWFNELASMKYGEVTSKGKIISFTLYPHPQLPTLGSKSEPVGDCVTHTGNFHYPHLPTDNPLSVGNCGQSVGNITHTLNPLPYKALDVSVGSVGKKSPPSENSKSLMMSCTTNNGAKNQKTTREYEIGDRVVVADPDSGIYKGAVGVVVEAWYTRDGQELKVEFDKKVRGVAIASFTHSQLMNL